MSPLGIAIVIGIGCVWGLKAAGVSILVIAALLLISAFMDEFGVGKFKRRR